MIGRSSITCLCFLTCLVSFLGHAWTCHSQTIIENQAGVIDLPKPGVELADPALPGDRSEFLLPPTTCAWISVPDTQSLVKAIEQTSFGRMLEDAKIEPFAQDLADQVRGWLDSQKVQIGLDVEDLKAVSSGEICLAGVYEPAEGDGTKADYASVLLVDVSETGDEARQLLEKIDENLAQSSGERETMQIGDLEVTKWTLDLPKGIVGKVYSYQTICDRWLITCTNEKVFRDLLARIQATDPARASLSQTEAFQQVSERCSFQRDTDHLHWFVEPFDYMALSQSIAEERRPDAREKNDLARIFRREGFGAIQGLGGSLVIAESPFELVHRSFVFAPPVPEAGDDRYERAAAMLDFTNESGSDLMPPSWVPLEASTYMSFTWNLQKALRKVGYIVEALGATEGGWDSAIRELKEAPDGPKVDIPLLLEQLENRITLVAATEYPISETSERVVFGINVTGDESIVREHTRKLVTKTKNGTPSTVMHGDLELWVVDTKTEESGGALEIENDPLKAILEANDAADEEPEAEVREARPLFERRVATVTNGVLLVCNDVDYLKQVVDNMEQNPGHRLMTAADYVQIRNALDGLSESIDGISVVRHFGRLDASLETNYEMLRQEKMGSSKTLLAQLINQLMDADPEAEPRKQELDPSKMPEDYRRDVAPYLGTNGVIVKETGDGWILFGCLLPKDGSQAMTSGQPELGEPEAGRSERVPDAAGAPSTPGSPGAADAAGNPDAAAAPGAVGDQQSAGRTKTIRK